MYKIKALVGGLIKDGILEEGKLIRRKLQKGEIVLTETVHPKDMESGYYLIIKPKIQREATSVACASENVSGVSEVISALKTSIESAQMLIEKLERKEEIVKEDTKAIEPIDTEEIDSKFIISEDEADALDNIFDEQKFQNHEETYQRLIKNTLMSSRHLGSSNLRGINAMGFSRKQLPTVSQANAIASGVDVKNVRTEVEKEKDVAAKKWF